MGELHPAWHAIPTPAYVIDEGLLRKNLELLAKVERDTGAKILLAQKCFSMYHFYPLIGEYISGTTASGLYEARLGREEMGKENHVFSPAYTEEEMEELVRLCDHISFNSLRQWRLFGPMARRSGVSCGLRINPEYSTQEEPIYDPCAPGSRLGARLSSLLGHEEELKGLEGLHFHTLCEQGAEPLAATLAAVEEKFAFLLKQVKWVNLGGGHHITKPGYNLPLLYECIEHLHSKYGVAVYLEPGEAVALNAGFLVASVLEVQEEADCIANAILDASAACHMPDVLEMPYRPEVVGAGRRGEKPFSYRFGGATCLAGDIIGEYSFDAPLTEGDRVVFCDMAIYSMVKNNTFNGMPLPTIAASAEDGTFKIIKRFSYENFKARV